jgi:MFS family permease
MALSNVAAIGFGLAGALFVDYWQREVLLDNQILGFTLVFLFGAIILGMASPLFISRMPEPLMSRAAGQQPSLRLMLKEPFRDRNFKQLLNFLFFLDSATTLALPFITIYMLQQMGLPLSAVVGLNTLSQLGSILFLRVWGPFSDRFGSKAILSLSSSLQLLVILGWIIVTLSQGSLGILPLVVTLQIFAGIASAGMTLSASTLSIKLAPQEKATAYLAVQSLVVSLGAGLGPLVGGVLADFFCESQLIISFQWIDPSGEMQFPIVRLVAYTLLFSLAFIVGLITLNALTTIEEEGGASREVVLATLLGSTQQITRTIGSVPALRLLGHFAYAHLRHIPGLDVAVGVTTYQIAAASKAAMTGVSRGGAAVLDLTEHVRDAVHGVVRPSLFKTPEAKVDAVLQTIGDYILHAGPPTSWLIA